MLLPQRIPEDVSPDRISESQPDALPSHLYRHLAAQRYAILAALKNSFSDSISSHHNDSEIHANALAIKQLSALLTGVIERGEGNSCLVIGPKGSGKSETFERALSSLKCMPIVIRLSGYIQRNDRLALREIIRQVSLQTDRSITPTFEKDVSEEDDPFNDNYLEEPSNYDSQIKELYSNPTTTNHLSTFISTFSDLPRPVIVLLDAFDLFTMHPRQALLYCLLDAVQSRRYSSSPAKSALSKGLGIIGLTSRVDVVNLLEKRVKSRFSHRLLRTSGLEQVSDWIAILRQCLEIEISRDALSTENDSEWRDIWQKSIERLLRDKVVTEVLRETFGITKDIRVLSRAIASVIAQLNPKMPFLSADLLRRVILEQRSPQSLPPLIHLPYASLCLLIAAQHTRISGHEVFNFEMLHTSFRDQVRTSTAAPVLVGGAGIGMLNFGRGVMWTAFEQLVRCKIFRTVDASTVTSSKEFLKYRCTVSLEEVKSAIDRSGHTNLRKWLSKAQ